MVSFTLLMKTQRIIFDVQEQGTKFVSRSILEYFAAEHMYLYVKLFYVLSIELWKIPIVSFVIIIRFAIVIGFVLASRIIIIIMVF